MNKLSRFNNFGIEEKDKTVTTADGDTAVTVNAEPPKDNGSVEDPNPETTDASTDTAEIKPVEESEEGSTEEPEETTDEDLEIKEDDSEEVVEEKEKKIKIEIEIAQEQISDMSKAVSSLESICNDMQNSLQKGGLSVQGRAIAKTSVQHIAKQFKIEQSPVSSLESYGYQIDDFHATKVSIEGIKETILKMIEWIKEKLKKLKDFLFNKSKVVEKKIDVVKEKETAKSEQIKESIKDGSYDSGLRTTIVASHEFDQDDYFILNSFIGGLEKENHYEDIEHYLEKLFNKINIVKGGNFDDFNNIKEKLKEFYEKDDNVLVTWKSKQMNSADSCKFMLNFIVHVATKNDEFNIGMQRVLDNLTSEYEKRSSKIGVEHLDNKELDEINKMNDQLFALRALCYCKDKFIIAIINYSNEIDGL